MFIHNDAVFITGRNEVVAKVMFLLVSVILSTGGAASVHARIPPPGRRPPGKEAPPKKKSPPAYGQWAAGAHPTGMHSCLHDSLHVEVPC